MRAALLTTIVAMVGAATLVTAGCEATILAVTAEGSGNVITREVRVEGFDKVRIENQFTARIIKGDEFRVSVRIDDNLVQDLDIGESGTRIVVGDRVVRNRTLHVRLQPDRSYSLRNATLEVEIVTPDLSHLDLSGASDVRLIGFEGQKALTVRTSGASRISGEVSLEELDIDASGASKVRLTGTVSHVALRASGAVTMDLRGIEASTADVDASGASRVHVSVTSGIDAVASGASHVTYRGPGELGRWDTSGAAKITSE